MEKVRETITDDERLQVRFMLVNVGAEYNPLHWHGHLEVILMLKGRMKVYMNQMEYEIEEDSMIVIDPKEMHATRTFGEVSYVLLQIPFDFMTRVIDNIELVQFQKIFRNVSDNAETKELYECIIQMHKDYEEKPDGYRIHFLAEVYQFLYRLYYYHSAKIQLEHKRKEDREYQRIECVCSYVKKNYKRQITLDEISGLLSISPEYFCRLFKQYTGQTFLEYVNSIRLMHFYQGLIETNYSITELLARNGITNYKVFMKLFKKNYGTTPGKVRSNLKGAE